MNRYDVNGIQIPPEELEFEQNVFTQISASKETGTIINEVSYADRDLLQVTGGQMRFSDQYFQAWEKEGGGNELKTLIQLQVQKTESKAAMVKSHRDRKFASSAANLGPR